MNIMDYGNKIICYNINLLHETKEGILEMSMLKINIFKSLINEANIPTIRFIKWKMQNIKDIANTLIIHSDLRLERDQHHLHKK